MRRTGKFYDPGSAERGRLRDNGIVPLTGQATSSRRVRQQADTVQRQTRAAALFFLTPGAARSFFSGKSRKERMGGASKQVTSFAGENLFWIYCISI
jgi:hypothetical protein